MSKEIIAEKISNQRALLKRYEKSVDAEKLERTTKKLKQTADKLPTVNSRDVIVERVKKFSECLNRK